MFIRRTYFQPLSSDNVSYSCVVYVPAPDGSVDVSISSAPPAPLPSYDTLQLDNMLAAGVPLEKVNPHILGTRSLDESSAVEKILDIVDSNPSAPAESPSAPAESPSAPAESPSVAPTDHL